MQISQPQNVAALPRTPWKNGGGTTRTLFVHPPQATMENFDWRISLAEVAAPGPFSLFPGIDRTILLWSGSGLLLQSSTLTYALERPFEPFSFPGEEPITTTLIAGPTTDLNIMVRRNHLQANVELRAEPVEISPNPNTLIALCITGAIWLANQTIPANHYLRLDNHPTLTVLPSTEDTTFLLITLQRIKS
jgi:environmental stress-induced protein Ves